MSLKDEQMHLREAIEHVALAEDRIKHQEGVIHEMEKDGHDTSLARRLLSTMRETRLVMLGHKACVLASIERLKRGGMA